MITTPHSRPFSRLMLNRLSDAGVDLTKLVLYSTFDDDNRVTDISGGENHGTLTEAYIDAGGRYGKSLFMDDTDDDVTFANENNFDIGATENFSIWFWTKPNVIALSTIISKNTGGVYYLVYVLGDGVVIFGVGDDIQVPVEIGAGGDPMVVDSWTHIVAVFNRSDNTTKLFRDGVQSGSDGDITDFAAISNATSCILGGNELSFGSNTDIVGFTKEALDINTINNLYNMGL